MKLISIQVALFASNLISRPDKLKDAIEQKMGGKYFDAMPLILNLPNDAPADLPIVQAKSTNGKYSLNLSRKRLDFAITPDFDANDDPHTAFSVYKSTIEKYCKAALSEIDFNRIGIVITLFEEAESNIHAIFQKYLKTPFNPNYVETNVRFNYLKKAKGLTLNNIRIIETGDLHIDRNGVGEDKKGVVIQLDTNNVPGIQICLTMDNILTVIAAAIKNLEPEEIKEMI